MKINKNILLHASLALAAVLVLALPPLIDRLHPKLTFQPLIDTMEATSKEQNEKLLTIRHALQGNAIFFFGASEVSWSQDEPYSIYNYFNNNLHTPVVAYGNAMVEGLIQYSLLSYFKQDLSHRTKLVLLLSPDNYSREKLPPRVFERNIPDSMFNALLKDPDVSALLKGYLASVKDDNVDHFSYGKLKVRGGSLFDYIKETRYQIGSFAKLNGEYYLQLLHLKNANAEEWPSFDKGKQAIAWEKQIQLAKEINEQHHETAETHWTTPDYFERNHTAFDWDAQPPVKAQITVLDKMMAMLHQRQVDVVVIIDPINPWAVNHTERFKQADAQITDILKKYQIPYYDMYQQSYQNGWNRDYLHPTDLAWVAMDRYVYEHFK